MEVKGLSRNAINNIFSCIEERNFVEDRDLKNYTNWLMNYIS